MYFRSFLFSTIAYSLILTVILLSLLSVSLAQVRTSSNYQLQSDSINFGGGLSTSSNYTMESTAGEVATGVSTSTNFQLRAGYQQMQEVFLSMSGTGAVMMVSDVGGITGGLSNGSTSVLVTTDSPSGYSLTIKAEGNPAMQKGSDNIADYVPASFPNPDPSFVTAPTDAHFGFTPEGEDIVPRFRDNGSGTCFVGALDTLLTCWDGLSTTAISIAQGGANQPSGATTTINFRLEVGGDVVVPAGVYVATTTLTAIPL